MEPKFKHDCDECQFLGHIGGHDLYFCASEPTVIARYGSDTPSYRSGMTFARPYDVGDIHPLYVAKLIAIDKKLLPVNRVDSD